ncbi:oligosaccharide flippase family protein [Demequina activiva]|uniref:Membrane protein involved in the export of O-antigen and teichoic acid n=1 Tax=Demequina activiva TaxID=1582364 RepID=A0A919Q0H3_9MICO|nr:oligosaccharide flippase family protein [Demequina activiva]GIG53429.1 hypothetical protein Dac01nite_01810 [Demequina activiva]
MTTASAAEPNYRRATVMMTATSMLVPLGGLVTAPVLAQGLGPDGRGELAAILAPGSLMLGFAAMGLPHALTFFVAKRPSITRRALTWASAATASVAALCILPIWWALPFLSAGDEDLARLILLASIWNVPALVVGVMRGAAAGRQMWGTIAWERIVLTTLRVAALFALLIADRLTVETAVIVTVGMPILSGVVYARLFARPLQGHDQPTDDPRVVAPLFRYGSAVWFGSIASMTIGRLASLLMLPLSDAEALGLYTVATTIADVPIIVAIAIQSTLFGVSSKSTDPGRVTLTARLTLIFGFAGCLMLGATLPWWIGPLFGEDFVVATVPTLMLLVSALILVPGLMASSGLGAWGRPALRSVAEVASLVVRIASFVLLVPAFGVYGAAWSAIIGTVTMTAVSVTIASRVMGVRPREFLMPGRSDVARAWSEVRLIVTRVTSRLTRRG